MTTAAAPDDPDGDEAWDAWLDEAADFPGSVLDELATDESATPQR